MSPIEKLYRLKGRDRKVPIAIMLSEVQDIECYACVSHLPAGLLHELFPGRVTILVPRHPRAESPALSDPRGPDRLLSEDLNPGLPSIGIRIPDDAFCRGLGRAVGAIALTSANLSGHHSTVAVEEFRDLWGECDAVFDGGRLDDGRSGSTMIDLTVEGSFKIIRVGSGCDELRESLQERFGLIERQ